MHINERLSIYFSLVEDTRDQSYTKYKLEDVLFLLVCGVICGCYDIEEIFEFAEEREEFFLRHTKMERIPCHRTLLNILQIIKPDRLELCLYGILRNVFGRETQPKEKQICIDGKTVCSTAVMGDYDQPLHIITGLLADSCVSLGQITVDSKSNEIPAVRNCLT